MTGFQKLCLITIGFVVLLIVIGGVVRATGSGLGCPDWPTCHGKVIPQWEKHTLIEYSHRLTASIVGFLVLGIVIAAFRTYRNVPAIFYSSILAGVLVLIQAGLGGAAVVNDLPSEIIMLHLGMALAILALLTIIATASFAVEAPLSVPAVSPAFRRFAIAGAVLVFATMLVGAYASGAGYGLACSGWPLCNGDVMPAGSASVQTIYLHRLLALSLGIAVAGLAWVAWSSREKSGSMSNLAAIAVVLYAAQVLLGAANVWSRLNDVVDAAHLALGALLWLCLALINIRTLRLYELLPLGRGKASRAGLAGQAR